MVLAVLAFFFQSSLQHNSSDSEHSIRPYPQGFYGHTPAPPSFTAMPILGMPRNQIHGSKPAPHAFNSYDHQRVGSFRSRLKKQNPIFCNEGFEPASMNVSVPVEVERGNLNINRDILSPPQPPIQLQPVIKNGNQSG